MTIIKYIIYSPITKKDFFSLLFKKVDDFFRKDFLSYFQILENFKLESKTIRHFWSKLN